MAIPREQVLDIKKQLEPEYQARHEAFRRLRDYYQGRWWDNVDSSARGVASLFRDLSASQSDIGPDTRVVHNILQEIVTKYQTYLSPLPMIRVPVDPPESNTRRAQATKKERALYALWNENSMNRVLNKKAWYLPLFGDCFLGIHPDFDRSIPRAVLRSPEHAYPIPSFSGDGLGAVVFSWKVRESVLRREFPNYTPQADRRGFSLVGALRKSPSDPEVEYLEYSDQKEWRRWADDQELNGVEHNFGFNLFDQVPFIEIPDEPWNHGAVEQMVNLNEAHNVLYSLMMQSVYENVFPLLVLTDPSKAPEEIDKGAGGVIPLNPGGKAEYLSPPVQALAAQAGFLGETERAMKEQASMPDVNFGQFRASIVTGKAINELQGAGTGSTIEMVQGAGIGTALESWNEKALFMLQRMFRDDPIRMDGIQPRSGYDINSPSFVWTGKGKDLIGSQRNVVAFSVPMGQHEKLVMWLQAKGGGLVSNKHVAEQIGISDWESMSEEIFAEAIDAGVLGAILGEMQAQPNPQTAEQAEKDAFAYMQGQTGNHPSPNAGQASPALLAGSPAGAPPPGAAPAAPPQTGAPPQPPAGPSAPPPAASAAGPPPPSAPPPEAQPAGGKIISLDEAQAAFQQVQGITGRVFLVGEIVIRGETDADIEVALTEKADQDTLNSSLQQYAGRLVFHLVSGEPSEAHLEVTPGKPAARGGDEQQTPEALSGIFVS